MSGDFLVSAHITVRRRAKDGRSITIANSFTRYAESGSGTEIPAAGQWQTTIPSVAQGNYLWTWTHVVYSDNTMTDSYTVSRCAKDGPGITGSVTKYCEKTSTSVSPQNFAESAWGDFPANLTDGNWLYSRTVVTYSDNQTSISYDVYQIGQGSYYAGLQEYYTATAAGVHPADYPGKQTTDQPFVNGVATYSNGQTPRISTSIWKTTIGAVTLNSSKPQLWNFEISRDSKGNKYVTEPRPIGNYSKSIDRMSEDYAISSSGAAPAGALYPADITSWQSSQSSAVPTAQKPYQWNRTTVYYTDNTNDVFYHLSTIRGEKGDQGAPGRGVQSSARWYCLTMEPVPPLTTHLTHAGNAQPAWYLSTDADCPTAPTESLPYLWECEVITYTDNTSVKILRLTTIYGVSSVRPNLLEQTAFDSEDRLDKWDLHNGSISPDVREGCNGFFSFPEAPAAHPHYTDFLRQIVYAPARVVNNKPLPAVTKLQPDSWHTLSFYSRTRRFVNATSNLYGFPAASAAMYTVYLHGGNTYHLVINGHCSVAARASQEPVTLRGYIFGPTGQGNDWLRSVNVGITDTHDVTAESGDFTIPSDGSGTYRILFYAFKSQNHGGSEGEDVTINWFSVKCTTDRSLIHTYIYSSPTTQPLIPGSTYIVDGKVRQSLSSDGMIAWTLDDDIYPDLHGWTRHYVSFKTKQVIPDAIQNVLFRLFNSYVELCQIKLEQGIMDTPWQRNKNDSQLTFSRNPAGIWESGNVYYYFDGNQDFVYAARSANDDTAIPYILIKRTTALGYTSNIPPYNDPEHWEPANYQRWVACEAMFSKEIFTDKLITSHARSDNSANPAWELKPDGSVVLARGMFRVLTDGGLVIGNDKIILTPDGEVVYAGKLSAASGDFTGKLTTKGLYTHIGSIKTVSGQHYVDLSDSDCGNTYVIPSGVNVNLPLPTDYEGVTITVFFGHKSGLTCIDEDHPDIDGILSPYYTLSDLASQPSMQSMEVSCFLCFSSGIQSMTSLTLHAMRPDGPSGTKVRWVVTGQRGILKISDYYSSIDSSYMALTPDGRLIL